MSSIGGDDRFVGIAGREDRASAQTALAFATGDPRFSPDAEAVEDPPPPLG